MILAVLLILVLSFVAELFLPWWSIVIVAFAVGWKTSTGWKAFAAGFLGVSVLWLLVAGFIHFKTRGILTARVGEMFSLPLPILVVLITGLIGGLVGGLAAGAGFHLRRIFKGLVWLTGHFT